MLTIKCAFISIHYLFLTTCSLNTKRYTVQSGSERENSIV